MYTLIMDKFNIADILQKREVKPLKKIDYEFQQLGLELQEWFPKKDWPRIWTMFYKKGFNERLIRDAFLECKKRKVKGIGYLIAIVNNKLT